MKFTDEQLSRVLSANAARDYENPFSICQEIYLDLNKHYKDTEKTGCKVNRSVCVIYPNKIKPESLLDFLASL